LGRRSVAAGGRRPLERRDPARAGRLGRLRLRPADVHPGVRGDGGVAREGSEERAQPSRDRGGADEAVDAAGVASLRSAPPSEPTVMPTTIYCWRCRMDMPMLTEDEWRRLSPLMG